MNILVTGGCGNMGGRVVEVLAKEGHKVRVLDKNEAGLKTLQQPGVETLCGDISDQAVVQKAVEDMNAIIHLAWSFSADFSDLLDIDIKGYQYLLDAAVANKVDHIINAGTAVAYGKPQCSPVDENHPHIIAQARKPAYALAKLVTEEMGKVYAWKYPIAINTVMIWYAYGNEIGGKHIRGMIKDALTKGEIVVPASCGGSFLQLDDFIDGVQRILEVKPRGELFNLSTVYLTWEELAQMIVDQANPQAKVVAVPREKWQGSSFLTDDWCFDISKAERILGYKTRLSREEAVKHLEGALKACVAEVKSAC
ncbi:MAG: NAD(P)-dependent oxidoreductase [Deltaproteobacteria bacterium]|nr:NAD(P)-dependent oxidoreductase [Deltaproteobacteria bacterium]